MFSCLQILEAFLWFVLITLLNVTLIILTLSVSRLLNLLLDRKSGSAGMPRPISYAVFCLKKKKRSKTNTNTAISTYILHLYPSQLDSMTPQYAILTVLTRTYT